MNTPSALTELATLTAEYDSSCQMLEELVAALESDLSEVKARHLAALKRQATLVARREAGIRNLVAASPGLFEKPRTMTLNGVRVGFSVSQGKVEWDDEETVVAAIRRFLKDDVSVLLQEKASPRKDALRALPASDLARIGCRIVDSGDQVLVKRQSGDVEKLIDKLTEKLVARMVNAD